MHSTESALLKVFNDIFLATDSGDSVILVLLDLTAAFDTLDHEIRISCLEQRVGIKGQHSNGSGRTWKVGLSVSAVVTLNPPPLLSPVGFRRAQF